MLKYFLILLISFNLNFVWLVKFVLPIVLTELHSMGITQWSCTHLWNISKLYCHFFFKIIKRKQTSKISQFFTCKHKINESIAEVPTHYWITCLYSKNVCFDAFISNEFFNFFRNMLNTKTTEIDNFSFSTK